MIRSPRPLPRLRTALMAALALWAPLVPAEAQQARTHAALTELVPLLEVYDARRDSPAYDVAGIRCGGLTVAQQDWAERNPGTRGPSRAALRASELNLTRAELARQQAGQPVSRAYASTRDDVLRVIGLYRARFEQNARDGSHPWNGDPLITGDTTYCDMLNR